MSKSQLPSITEAICTFARLVRELLSIEAAIRLVTTLKALFDPVRLRLLSVVASHEGGEACVCDISATIDLSQPTISHHLKCCARQDCWAASAAAPGFTTALIAVCCSNSRCFGNRHPQSCDPSINIPSGSHAVVGQPPWLAYAAMVVPTASAFCCVQKRQHALPVWPQQRMD